MLLSENIQFLSFLHQHIFFVCVYVCVNLIPFYLMLHYLSLFALMINNILYTTMDNFMDINIKNKKILHSTTTKHMSCTTLGMEKSLRQIMHHQLRPVQRRQHHHHHHLYGKILRQIVRLNIAYNWEQARKLRVLLKSHLCPSKILII